MIKKTSAGALAAALVCVAVWKVASRSNPLYAGTVEATEVDVSSRLTSVLSSVGVKEGDDVAAGQSLARLDCEDMKLAADIARKDYEKAKKLLGLGAGMTQETYDRLKYKFDDAQVRLSWCSIAAPSGGRILYVYHEAGEWVMPGSKLLTLADLKEVHAYVYVPQPMLAKLSVGMQVQGYLPELGMRPLPGRIVRINDEAEFTPRNVQTREERTRLVYGIKTVFPNPDGVLKPGMTVEINFPLPDGEGQAAGRG
ncbi:MAG: efflux RND transporter periplasmic adaptor subunit [Elusimicrobia bacterium]|nr:efflux RND transporter periplasmic adaptor subunit [Elusimicrobiota bacterium]